MKMDLKMNLNKTQIMNNSPEIVKIDNNIIIITDQYIYLGHAIRIGKENQSVEISRRIGLLWLRLVSSVIFLRILTRPINQPKKENVQKMHAAGGNLRS